MITYEIGKEYHKFSSGHFTIFPDGSRERLHGHNYQASATVVADADAVPDYRVLKDALLAECEALDEYVLIPSQAEGLGYRVEAGSCEVTFGGDRFVFPEGDVRVLPVENASVECLAEYILDGFARRLTEAGVVYRNVAVTISSGAGQQVRVDGGEHA